MYFYELINSPTTLKEPFKAYGWFHFVWIAFTIITSFLLCYFVARKHKDKYDKITLMSLGSILIIIEVLKQVFLFKVEGKYNFYIFPFQLCSLPMYLWIPVVLLKKGIIKDALTKFLATYTFFGGIAIYIYPQTCLETPYLFIAFHTMIWHAILIIIGAYLIVSKGYGTNYKKEVIPATVVFVIMVIIAIVLNEVLNAKGIEVNLFYISRKYGSILNINSPLIYKAGDNIGKWILFIFEYLIVLFGFISAEFFTVKLIRKIKFKYSK